MKLLIILVAVAVIAGLIALVGRGRRGPDKIVLPNPSIGFLDLLHGQAQSIVDEDKKALAPVFARSLQSLDAPPLCQVLFLYAKINQDGSLDNSPLSLREIIRHSGASVVVVASENESEHYIAAGKKVGYGYANLVMTLQRNGPSFTAFFKKLFADMMDGETMPVAWVKLAPQIPGRDQPNTPGTIFACEVGQVSFK
jgi:hypothetical protein